MIIHRQTQDLITLCSSLSGNELVGSYYDDH